MNNIENIISYEFKNKTLLNDALHHSSIKKSSVKFERLEFLGDRILGIVIAEYIFEKFKKDNEGSLSKMHAAFVCAKACHSVGIDIGLDKEINTAGEHLKQNKTVLADAMEALLGAIFIDAGFLKAKEIIINLWKNLFDNFDKSSQAPKTQLQELTQAKTGTMPIYTLVSVEGPDHMPSFVVSVTAIEETATGTGNSRKTAEADAAKNILEILLPK